VGARLFVTIRGSSDRRQRLDPAVPRREDVRVTRPAPGDGDVAELLRRIDRFEAARGSRLPRWVRTIGRTRAFAAVYRRAVVPIDRWLWRRDRGAHNRVLHFPGLLLTTTGARSGQPRSQPLIYRRDGADFVVVGTNWGQKHHPAWTANLLAHPDATVRVGPHEIPVRARLVTDDATWSRLWRSFTDVYPGYDAYLGRMGDRTPRMFVLTSPEAAVSGLRQAGPMTTPQPETPQPRDIALEQETPEQAADLEAQSDPEDSSEAN
jgi:deazaflavin-dependent oxidoreductase (nitroreductase family)